MQIFEIVGDVKDKNILLLQGPMGTFFNYLDKKFAKFGANTFRVGLNAADAFFADTKHYTPFKGKLEEWEDFIGAFYSQNAIEMLFVFGDCRVYQSKAIEVAKTKGIEVFVFEEGYIRPDFVTLEKDGANANSTLPRDREFYDALDLEAMQGCIKKNIRPIGSTYAPMAIQAIIYYMIADIFRASYPHYQHHRRLSVVAEGLYGLRNFYRKNLYRLLEFNKEKRYVNKLDKAYYFVALQTFEDFQIKEHSDYDSIEAFIEEVLISYVKHAPKDTYIVFKHHPMDRGKKDYYPLIRSLATKYDCLERVDVVYDMHLPTLLKHAIATVTVNSTVGISSMFHKTPTFCTGRSMYDIEGLTSKGLTLDRFWNEYKEVDELLFEKFRCYLIEKTQINDSFYI